MRSGPVSNDTLGPLSLIWINDKTNAGSNGRETKAQAKRKVKTKTEHRRPSKSQTKEKAPSAGNGRSANHVLNDAVQVLDDAVDDVVHTLDDAVHDATHGAMQTPPGAENLPLSHN